MAEPLSQEEAIFHAALAVDAADQRAAYLDEACGGQPELRRRVEALLRRYAESQGPLDRAVGGAVATTAEPPAERPGAFLGAYKLLEQIGEGGMGIVWMAQQTEPVKRLVAVKLIKAGMDTKQVLARFEAERQALALMDHPHIARVLDGGTTAAGRPYFVMDLVKGVPITRYCDERRLTPRQRLELFLPVCQAVQHAHQKGIIHCDLKPSNVLVALYDGNPVPKVIDFGVAKATGQALTDKTLVTGFGNIVGTLEYMSPEQAEINQMDIDTRSDVYSLGVLLYELLAGSPPFSRKELEKAGMLEMLRVIREQEPSRPSTKLSTAAGLPTLAANRGTEPAKLTRLVRGELDWIVMKALEKDRSRRYETANGFAQDVQRFLADEPVQACPPSAWYRFRKFARRNRSALAVAGLVLFFITSLGGGGGWVVRDRSAREQEFAHERVVREAALDGEVRRLLEEASRLSQLGNWPEAMAVVERADQLLASAGRSERPPRLLGLQKDLNMARRLEDICGEPARDVMSDNISAAGERDAQFAREFRDFGIDIDALEPGEAAARIGRMDISQTLVRALDDWAVMRQRGRGDKDTTWKKLVEIAQQADRDEWRNKIRVVWLSSDRQALERLVDAVPLRDLPPATFHLLGSTLKELRDPERAMSLLQQAQRKYPDDLWINDTLGRLSLTARPPRYEDALRFYTAASALRPRSARWHHGLAQVFRCQEAEEKVVAELSRALELAPGDVLALLNRGLAYERLGADKKALADYSMASELEPKDAQIHSVMGFVLQRDGQLDKAIAEYRKAIELKPDVARTHYNLGNALREKGRLDDAVAEYGEAIRLKKDYTKAHSNLGLTLKDKGQLDEAIAECRKAIKLKPDDAQTHNNLGAALFAKGLLDEAIAEWREALRIRPNDAEPHSNLGHALRIKGRLDEALAECKEAVRLNKDFAQAHCNLGLALQQLGEFRQALEELRKGHELGSRNPRWRNPSAEWVRQCERLVDLDRQLPVFLAGKTTPASPAERIELAALCSFKRLHAAAARFSAEAFAAEPRLAKDLGAAHRYNAACAAALAGCGKGKDADQLHDQERARLRRQALGWLRADLEVWERLLDKAPEKARSAAQAAGVLLHWLVDGDFAGLRGPEALTRLPEAERRPWQELWKDVANALARAQRITTPEKK
jgi:tetratricopeptide (TPR) repeat protein/serine/threonine protein kinase